MWSRLNYSLPFLSDVYLDIFVTPIHVESSSFLYNSKIIVKSLNTSVDLQRRLVILVSDADYRWLHTAAFCGSSEGSRKRGR